MKNINILLLSLTLVCLLAPAGVSGGTIGTGGDRTSPTPTPAPSAQGTSEGGIQEEPTPDAGGEEDLAEMMVREALLWIASWPTLL